MARLKEEWESDNDGSPPEGPAGEWSGVRGFKSSFIPTNNDHSDTPAQETLDRFYFAFLADEETPQPSAVDPSAPFSTFDPTPFSRLTPEEVAEDLGIQETDTAAIMLERRRQFARISHPDRVPEQWRDQANLRMTLANLLIDEALKQTRPRA